MRATSQLAETFSKSAGSVRGRNGQVCSTLAQAAPRRERMWRHREDNAVARCSARQGPCPWEHRRLVDPRRCAMRQVRAELRAPPAAPAAVEGPGGAAAVSAASVLVALTAAGAGAVSAASAILVRALGPGSRLATGCRSPDEDAWVLARTTRSGMRSRRCRARGGDCVTRSPGGTR
jgi:hypothetical protein